MPTSYEQLTAGPKGGATLHSQLSGQIREKIYAGEWLPGDRIPSEHALMEESGLSRGTIRRAIKSLVDEGLLRKCLSAFEPPAPGEMDVVHTSANC